MQCLKRVAAVLDAAGIPFILGGGLAAWAHGGPPTEHDIDLIIRASDRERALEALTAEGLRAERPPEGWLVKVWDGDILVDLIFDPSGLRVDQDLFERSEWRNVESMKMRVLSMNDVLVTKLTAIDDHHVDYNAVLEYARSLREQVDWARLEADTKDSPFARAFFYLLAELGVHPCRQPGERLFEQA